MSTLPTPFRQAMGEGELKRRIRADQIRRAQFDAVARSVMLCIAASECPTCGAMPHALCTSKSGKVVPSHVTRTKAGHELIKVPVAELSDVLIRGRLERTQP